MFYLKMTVVCVTLFGTVYVSETRQRNVKYFQDDLCRLRVTGSISNEDIQEYGRLLKQSTQKWLRKMKETLHHWNGTRSWKEGCRIHGRKKALKKMGTIPVMFFLEYLTILQQTEERKASRMLFNDYLQNADSHELINGTTSTLCYLLAGLVNTETSANNVKINVCSNVVQRSNVSQVMELMVGFGHCLSRNGTLSSCTRRSGVVQGCYESPRRKKPRCRRCKNRGTGRTGAGLDAQI